MLFGKRLDSGTAGLDVSLLRGIWEDGVIWSSSTRESQKLNLLLLSFGHVHHPLLTCWLQPPKIGVGRILLILSQCQFRSHIHLSHQMYDDDDEHDDDDDISK